MAEKERPATLLADVSCDLVNQNFENSSYVLADKDIEVEEDPAFYFRQDSRQLPIVGTVGAHIETESVTEKKVVLLCEVDSMDMWVKVNLQV